MKINKLFIGALGALALTACSSEDTPDRPSSGNGDAETNYLAISIAATPAGTTRTTTGDGKPSGAEYENGEGSENTVNKVRFYFFDAEDNAAPVKNVNTDNPVSYYDIENPEGGGQESVGPVEKVLNAQLVLQTPTDKVDAHAPVSIVAIVNPEQITDFNTWKNKNLSLAELNGKIAAYTSTESGFVMSNSIYAKGSPLAKVEAISIKDRIYPTPELAKANPVNIYVERVLAKVRLSIATGSELTTGTKTVSIDGKEETIYNIASKDSKGSDVYAHILGWNATAKADKSRLMKEISTRWTNSNVFTDWNYPDYYRSFWALNPDGLGYTYGPFNTAGDADRANAYTLGASTYIQENANAWSADMTPANPTTPTQVIIAAKLVNENGTTVDLAEWGFQKYTLADLKKAMLTAVELYKKVEDTEGSGYAQITENDVDFKTATAMGTASSSQDGRYYVYLQLNKDAKDVDWYTTTDLTEKADADALLKDLGPAKVWKDGYTYYYFDISHLNGSENGVGQKGVVRNHIYDTMITSITGLGTPVYDPTENIIPERPGQGESYVAARMKVLSWRVVKQNQDLSWPK